jgi:uncharacterized protein (DUF433 family)
MIQRRLASLVHDLVTTDPEILDGMPVVRGTRVPVYDLAASLKAGVSRDRILAAYPAIKDHHLDLAVAYAEANPWPQQTRGLRPVTGATPKQCGQIPRRKR